MAKSLDIEIQEYLPFLGNEEKKSILGVMKSFVLLKREGAKSSFVRSYNEDIEQSLSDVAAGRFISQVDLEKEIHKWKTR